MKTPRTKRANPSGMAIAIVLVILFVLSVLGFAFGSRGTMALSQAYTSRQYMMAFYAAQSGVMSTMIAEQQTNINNPTTGVPTNCAQTSTPTSLTIGAQTLNLPYTFPDNATFSVTITNNTSPQLPLTSPPVQICAGSATAPDGTVIPPGYVYITARGTAQGKTKISNVMVPVTYGSPPVDFNYGLYGQNYVHINNNGLVNSYNSGNGAYGGSNIGSNGNIGTNSGANGAVTLANNAVAGQVAVGPGGTPGSPTITTGSGATYSSAVVLSTPVQFPVVTDANGFTDAQIVSSSNFNCPNNANCTLTAGTAYNNITADNNTTITVGCGNYSMGSIDLLNNVTLTVNCSAPGAVKFYVHGGSSVTNPIDFSNNSSINSSGVPSTFQLYDISSATGCSGGTRCSDIISNNGTFYGAFYGANSNVSVANNGSIYGAIVGYDVTLQNNGAVHYDQALANTPIGTATTPTVVGNFTVWNFQ